MLRNALRIRKKLFVERERLMVNKSASRGKEWGNGKSQMDDRERHGLRQIVVNKYTNK